MENELPENIKFRKTDGNKVKAMVVDDSQFMRNQVIKMLTSLDIEICCQAPTGSLAIELYSQYKPDIVTMDITMPDLDGLSALKKIKEFDKSARIIMITAIGNEAKVKECIMAGAIHFVVKPFQPAQASEKILCILKKYFG